MNDDGHEPHVTGTGPRIAGAGPDRTDVLQDPFDRERYERIRAMAVDMLSTQVDAPAGQVSRLLSAGYPTPKLDTRAAIFDEEGRILMTHENSGEWSLPGGWVDENQSIRSNAVKEVKEETELDVRASDSSRCRTAPITTR